MEAQGTYLALMTPSLRRCWLLHKALECAQLDRAIEIARSADAFIRGARADQNVTSDPVQAKLFASEVGAGVAGAIDTGATQHEDGKSAVTEINRVPTPQNDAATAAAPKDIPTAPCHKEAQPLQAAPMQTRPLISPEQRQELMIRMAKGASNAELAGEYGISPRQVQGIRMIAARTKGKRPQVSTVAPDPASPADPGIEDVVRYLRQQDDVVVPQGPGEFLLNGRFRMDTTELVSRANRMRSRQGKPAFHVNGHAQARPDPLRSTGHPMFWHGATNSASSDLS
jgi:DNA-binding CsgD family transcriptional regulator